EGGGTSILPALTAAYADLKTADTKLKHIILLTDGQAEQTGYDTLLQSMAADAVTLSCVAVGSDADRNLLQSLAQKGGGRYYFTDEFTDLPQIFAKETTVAGKTFLNNDPFVPTETYPSPILAEIPSYPPLGGYVATTAKDRADVLLSSEKGDPVLAAWTYGLGRSVAWTSDMNRLWSADWLASENGTAVFRNAVSWTLRKEMNLDAGVETVRRGDETEIVLTVPFSENVQSISGTAAAPNNAAFPLDFESTAPGVYKATLSAGDPGTYIARLSIQSASGESEGEGESEITLGINIPYSKEYDIRENRSGEQLMRRIAEESGGRAVVAASDVFLPFQQAAFGETDLSVLLLSAGLLLFLFDVAARRFSAIPAGVKYAFDGIASRLRTVFHAERTKKATDVKKNAGNADAHVLENASKNRGEPKATEEKKAQSTAADASGELLNRMRKRRGD
ncbi:MAG: VWA domain-containing protein, partial [Clostridiales bacterium]|nr:VWA domain-containing protein [Clostridiales bacterium]